MGDRFLGALNVGLGACGGGEKFRRVSKEPLGSVCGSGETRGG
jgi:hypothetical protein